MNKEPKAELLSISIIYGEIDYKLKSVSARNELLKTGDYRDDAEYTVYTDDGEGISVSENKDSTHLLINWRIKLYQLINLE